MNDGKTKFDRRAKGVRMKIDGMPSNVISMMDHLRERGQVLRSNDRKSPAVPPSAPKNEEAMLDPFSEESVNLKLSRALEEVVMQIQSAGQTAGEIHSFLDDEEVGSLLDFVDTGATTAQASSEQILSKADELAEQMLLSPALATRAFRPIQADRVHDLLSGE